MQAPVDNCLAQTVPVSRPCAATEQEVRHSGRLPIYTNLKQVVHRLTVVVIPHVVRKPCIRPHKFAVIAQFWDDTITDVISDVAM